MALNNAQERYTDTRRTRVYQREQEQFIGQTQAIAPKEKLLEGLSIPQVIAGAAAAATSVALASRIGIAGSVIGAAVSSVVTVLSSQVYRHFLSAGAAKLKHEPERPGPSSAYVSGYGYSERAAQGYYDRQPARYGARIAPTKLQARAAAERAATQRKVVMFSVGTAVLAVALSVAIILALTEGEGLGERVPTPWSATEPAQEQSDKTPETPQADASASTSQDTAASNDASTSSTPSSGTDQNKDSSSATGNSGTASNGTSNSETSGTDKGGDSDSQPSSGNSAKGDTNTTSGTPA
mgnify:FL=1